MVYLRTYVDADQDTLAPVVSVGITVTLIPAIMVEHA